MCDWRVGDLHVIGGICGISAGESGEESGGGIGKDEEGESGDEGEREDEGKEEGL